MSTQNNFMEAFFQGLQTNATVLVALVVLFFKIIKVEHKIEMAISRIDMTLKKHCHDIKRLKKANRQIRKHLK